MNIKKILIIDDEKEFCKTIKERVELSTSFYVEACSRAELAVQKAKLIKPDLILLDVMMPGITGPEIASQLKKAEETKNTPIIFLTAVLNEDEAEEHKHLIGGEYFLGKPVKFEDLLYMLNKLIG